MRVLVGQLNTAIPDLNLAIDKETGLLNMNEEAIQNVIAAKQEQLKMQAADERALELAKELVDIETQRALIEEKIAELALSAESGEIREKQRTEAVSELNLELENLLITEGDVSASLELLTEAQMASNQALEEMGLDEASLALAEFEAEVASLAETLGVSADAIKEHLEATGLSTEELAKTIENETDSINNSFKTIPEQFEMSLDELMEIQRVNIERYADFQRNITELSGKISSEALTELAALGPGANSVLDELIAGGQTKWDEYNALYAEKSQLAVSSAVGGIEAGALPAAAEKTVSDAGSAVAQNTELETAFETQASDSSDTFKTELEDANLPDVASKVVDDIGKEVEGNTSITDATKSQIEAAYNAADSEITSLNFPNLGLAMAQGLAEGLTNNMGLIITAARSAAQSAYNAAKSELDINSPSKRFKYLGEMSVDGYTEAIKEGQSSWESAVSNSIQNTLATADARRSQVASGYAASIVNQYSNSTDTSGDIVFEKGAIVVEGAPINSNLDAEQVGRQIGETAAKKIRLKGGLVTK